MINQDVGLEKLLKKMEKKYSAESWKRFYKPIFEKFFIEYKQDANILRITSFDVKDFLNTFKNKSATQVNYYNALSAFFSFAYNEEKIRNIMQDVEKPVLIKKSPQYIADNHITEINDFIQDDKSKLLDKLLLGLLLYTGLPRRYIRDLQNADIKERENSRYLLWITDEDGTHKIPISIKIQHLIKKYLDSTKEMSPHDNVFAYSQDTAISTRVTTLTKKITGHSYSPNVLSNTFIKMALAYNPDLYSVSKIIFKSVTTIEKHITVDIDDVLLERQTLIVDNLIY